MPDFPSLSDFTPDELILMADEHDDMAFTAMLENHPAMVRGDGFCQLLTGVMNPFANMMFGMNFPDAENQVAEVTSWLTEKKAPAFWWVGPCTQPSNIDQMLLAKGWREGKPAPAMVVDLARLSSEQGPSGLQLQEVETREELTAWQEVFSAGYELPIDVGRLIIPNLCEDMRLYTALLDGEPVGTTGLFTHKGVPGIYCVSTLPEYRGRGVGGAITALPLLEARERGYKVGTLQASSMGHPVYKRIGFEDVCQLRVFAMNM